VSHGEKQRIEKTREGLVKDIEREQSHCNKNFTTEREKKGAGIERGKKNEEDGGGKIDSNHL